MDSIPLETKANIFSYLSLNELQRTSQTCTQLRNDVKSEIVIKDALKNQDLTTLTLAFISEFSSFLSTEQMLKLDFKEKITHKKLWQIAETAANVTSLRKLKLIASLFLYKKEVDDCGAAYNPIRWLNDPFNPSGWLDEGIEIHKQQLPYYYLIALSGKRIIENLALAVEKNHSESPASLIALKSVHDLTKFYESCEKENAAAKVKTMTIVALDYSILKFHNRPAVVEILTTLWQQYPIKNFAPQNSEREYVLSEVFEGFCKAIESHQKLEETYSLGKISSLILEEEQVQAFLKVLPKLKFDYLSFTLSADIKPKTMECLVDTLCSERFVSQNSKAHLYLYLALEEKKETSEETEEEKAESRKIFKEMVESFPSLSSFWSGRVCN